MIIRRLPEDFAVWELPSEQFLAQLRSGVTVHARGERRVYRLRKVSLSTPEAIARLAKTLRIKPGVVGYGGLKDKHAVTEQLVTVPAPPAGKTIELASDTQSRIEDRGLVAEFIGISNAEMDASAIRGNRFEIVIREIQRQEVAEMNRRAEALSRSHRRDDAELVIINYYGDQRFGSARHGEGFAAAHLARGDFETALKLLIATPARKDTGARRTFTRAAVQAWGRWAELSATLPATPERRCIEVLARGGSFRDAFAALPNFEQTMCVEAFQSYLWNAAARRMIEGLSAEETGHLITTPDEFGEMVFPPANGVPPEWLETQMPMPAADAQLAAPWGDAMRDAIRKQGLEVAQLTVPGLRRPSFGAAMRPLVVVARGFSMHDPEPDDLSRAKPQRFKRRVSFELPRGAYATVVLRALGQT